MENKSPCCGAEILIVREGGICLTCASECPVSDNAPAHHTGSGVEISLGEETNRNPAI